MTRNTGFAGACNTGARAAGACDYLVFLNNDTIPAAGWLDALVAEAEGDDQVAAVGAKLLFPNGQVQHAGIVIHQNGLPYHVYAGFPGHHPAVNRPSRRRRGDRRMHACATSRLRRAGRVRRRVPQRLRGRRPLPAPA